MSGLEQNELHELLCAYLLGECTEQQRERVETALAESEELRAEKERLGATIGFVQGAFEGEESLSEEALARLLEGVEAHAATPKPGALPPEPVREAPIHQIAWYRRPMARAAAAVALLTGGILGIRSFDRGTAMHAPADQVAQLERNDETRRVNDPAPLRNLEGLGYLGGGAADVGGKPTGAPAKREAGAPEEEVLESLGYAGSDETGARERAQEGAADSNSLRVPGYGGNDGIAEALERVVLGARSDGLARQADATMPDATTPRAEPAAPIPSTPSSGRQVGAVRSALDGSERFRRGEEKALALARPAPQAASEPSRSPDPGVMIGSDSFFLGHGQEKQRENEPRSYRGPGDTVPPGGGSSKDNEILPRLSDLGYPSGAGAGPATSSEAPVDELAKESGPGRFGDEAEQRKGEADAVVDRWLRDGDGDEDLHWKKDSPVGGPRFDRAEIERMIELESNRVLRDCYRRPNEKPGAMYFRFWGDNAFELTELDRLSTFSVDVDTASYTLARRYLTRNLLPEKAQVRTEEFVNYFAPDLPAPTEETFAIHTELAPSLFGGTDQRWMLRVGVRGREVSEAERKPLAITFVVDVSGSMRQENRLELVKHSMRLLLSQLDARDSIAIVAYSKEARLILPMTSAAQRGVIESAIQPLRPEGSTNAEAGLKMGYEVALAGLDAGANNRVVFLSDGVANVGQIDQDALNADVRRHREQGIYLNTIGVGLGNHNDVFLEQLADKGDGICDYVDDEAAARRAIVDRFTGAFEPIASDVKIQVDFDPAQVYRYRLLGYENRAIADVDFRNDRVDAGEVGAGHQVVALYELERTSVTSEETPLATVRLRWKAPKGAGQDPAEVDVTEIERGVSYREAAGSFDAASAGYRKSVLVAQFAEFLRRSTHAAGDSYETLLAKASALQGQLGDPEFAEFVLMSRRAQELILAQTWRRGAFDRALDEYRRYQILRCELEELRRNLDAPLLEDLRRKNETLERQIRDLMRREIEERHG